MRWRVIVCFALTATHLGVTSPAGERKPTNRSENWVKASASTTKATLDGVRIVTVTLDIDKAVYLHANPANNEIFEQNATNIRYVGKTKPTLFEVGYPRGKTITVRPEKLDVYEGIIKIPVKVQLPVADTAPLEIEIRVQAFSVDGRLPCQFPGKIKLVVPN